MPGQNSLQIRLLGELEVARDGESLALPQSKKTRALLAYLAAVGRPQRRERLCTLLWDIPDDPRGSLRWSLSKLRGLVDGPERKRIVADRESVRFDDGEVEIDLHRLRSAAAKGLDKLSTDQLDDLARAFHGEFLEGLDLPNCPDFQAWCVAEREEIRALHCGILKKLLDSYASDPERALPHGRRLIQLDPYDESVRVLVVGHLAAVGRWDEAEQLYEAGGKILERLGGEHGVALERAWRQLRANPPAKASLGTSLPARPQGTGKDRQSGSERKADLRAGARLTLPDKPSIAILPFSRSDAGGSDQAYFSNGLAEDLAAALANARWCFVISPSSTFGFRDQAIEAAEIARDLGVRYIATGSLSKSKQALEVSAQVTDCEVGLEVLSERFEATPAKLSDLQAEIAAAIAGAIKSDFDQAAAGRARSRAFSDLAAWELCKQAQSLLREHSEVALSKAIVTLEKAIKRDPALSQAYSLSVSARFSQFSLDLVRPEPKWTDAVVALAERAVELDPKDPLAHRALGEARIIRREHQLAIPALESAIELNPSLAGGHYALGTAFVCSGRTAEAISHLKQAIRLSPYDPEMGFFLLRMAEAYLLLREYDKAMDWGWRALEQGPAQWMHYSVLVSALGHLDRKEDARALLSEMGDRWPDYTLAFVRDRHLFTDQIRLEFVGEPQLFTDQDVFAHYLDGLRKSGVSAKA